MSANESARKPETGDAGSEESVGLAILDEIRDRARANRQTITLAEPEDERVLQAADYVLRDGMAEIILLGDPEQLLRRAAEMNLNLQRATIIDPHRSGLQDWFAQNYFERRRHKGVTEEQARQVITDSLFFGASLVRAGIADGMVAGSISPTPKVIQSSLQCVGVAEGLKTVSSFFLMVTPCTEFGVNGSMIYADSGCVPDPTAEQLVDIAIASAQHCQLLLQSEPLIAFLSFSTYGSAKHPLVDKVIQAVELFRQRDTGYKADGELQLDAAIVPSVASRKAKDSPIAGRANVLIFPDLNAGNIGYKLTERFARGRAIGPILQGLDMPINDLSRGCRWQDIVDAVAITALQAQDKKARHSWADHESLRERDIQTQAAAEA